MTGSAALPFARLPFDGQLDRIAAAARGGSARALLHEAAELADSEPLGRLLDALGEAGTLESVASDLAEIFGRLPDASLQHLFTRETHAAVAELLLELAESALRAWPLDRAAALAYLARIVRRRAPERFARIVAEAGASSEPRALLFATGRTLAALARDRDTRERVGSAAARVIDALARAPKSISQANAERLLASRVYADPGHFFFELLQNADDAGATEWSAAVERDRVIITHDGEPFSFLDLVGVLSIGQTTKRIDQIGFFGVGFKSVYEICDRPRIHSGALSFEIAHVSIPRAIAAPDLVEGAAPPRTMLVLPYARDVDPSALHGHALAIPAETLMTLGNLRAIDVSGPRGERRTVRARFEAGRWDLARDGAPLSEGAAPPRPSECDSPALHSPSLGFAALAPLRAAPFRTYATAERHVRFDGERPEGRPSESRVLVAVSLDERGAPIPVDGPTLYAFLPTAERSGLRVLVHARFDVTLDRERLETSSAWNDALLAEAGLSLAELVAQLAPAHSPLPMLAAPSEIAPTVEPFAAALAGALRECACLRGAAGELLAPSRACLTTAALARALAGVDVGERRALAPLDPRERSVAAALGASELGSAELFAWLAAVLREGEPPPPWLSHAVLEAIDAPVADLHELAFAVDAARRLVAPARARIAPPALARLYAGLAPLVSSEEVAGWPASLRERVAFRSFDASDLAADLAGPLAPALVAREDELAAALAGVPDALLPSLSAVPIFRTTAGVRVSIDGGLARLDERLESIAELVGASRPLLDREIARRHAALVSRMVPVFDLDALAGALERGMAIVGHDRVAALLDREALGLPRALAARFASIALFADRHGEHRPLIGEGRALLAAPQVPVDLLPEWPWLAAPDGSFVGEVGPARVDATAIAGALAGRGDLPPIDATAVEAAASFVASRASELSRAAIDALAAARIWLDRDGVPRLTQELRRGTASASLDAFYTAAGTRTIASPRTIAILRALRIESRLFASDYEAAIDDLLAGADVQRELVAAVANDAARSIDSAIAGRIAAAPIFRDESGALRPLGAWAGGETAPRSGAGSAKPSDGEWGPGESHSLGRGGAAPSERTAPCRRAGRFGAVLRSTSIPLLSEADEQLFAPFLSAAGPAPASISDVARHAKVLLDRPDELVAALKTHASELDAGARAEVAALPLFASCRGDRRRASDLCDRAVFARALGDRLSAAGLDDALLDPADRALAEVLGATLRPESELAVERLFEALREEDALDAQPAFARSRGDLLALRALGRELGVERHRFPLGLRADGVLTAGRLHDASAATRLLIAGLPIARDLADETFARALLEEDALPRIGARRVADALRVACPNELPRTSHPVLATVSPVFAWLREHAAEISADENAQSALRGAAIFPSQRGTLRPVTELVLDPTLPDVGLGWGLAPDVPEDVARFLRQTFEIDRKAREAIVAHVLDGLDEARGRDDRARAAELVAFLAAALDAGTIEHDRLEERVRRGSVRARLQVPMAGGGWAKPRFSWMPADEVAERVEHFAIDLPPRVDLSGATPATRALLAACGARSDLDDDAIDRCLDGAIRTGAEARLALARYVAARVLETPRRRERWALDSRKWVPSASGALHAPSSLLWRDELSTAIFDEDDARFPHAQFSSGLPSDAGTRLGFAVAAKLPLGSLAGRRRMPARAALLDWLEEGLRSGKVTAGDVRATFGERLVFTDDEGVERAASELAEQGARELFGPLRGNLALSREHPRLARAIGIPARPNADMIIAFLVEVGARDDLDASERTILLRHVPQCYEHLADLTDRRPLPAGAAIAGVLSGTVVLRRIGDRDLRIDEPRGLAPSALCDPLPQDRTPALLHRLWWSGVPDLYSAIEVERVSAGERIAGLAEEADALRRRLAPALPKGAAARARAVESIEVTGRLDGAELALEADAALDDGTLYLTRDAIANPSLAAPFLAPDPKARAALLEWLENERAAPPRPRKAAEPSAARGLFERIGDFFRGPAPEETAPAPRPRAPKQRAPQGDVGRDFFRPKRGVERQLGGREGWLESRLQVPDFGFAFTPRSLQPPWVYAPDQVVTRFDRRGQRWTSERLVRPEPRSEAGLVAMNGRLPKGESTLPIPMYGRLVELRAADAEAEAHVTTTGETRVVLDADSRVTLRIALAQEPSFEGARPASADALRSFVPDEDLPDEVHELVATLGGLDDVVAKAFAARDFVRSRYRYDPTYLEDPSVGNFLARLARGRANEHVAALHATADSTHLGAGVCYELNSLVCEILRRTGVPAALATGWVLSDGALSEPDHLWAIALLEEPGGGPIWLPIDASSTRTGRPLRVPKRPPGRFRPPREREAKPPPPPRWESEDSAPRRAKKKERLPLAELHRLLRHLSTKADSPVDPADRKRLEEELRDPHSAASLLARMLSRR